MTKMIRKSSQLRKRFSINDLSHYWQFVIWNNVSEQIWAAGRIEALWQFVNCAILQPSTNCVKTAIGIDRDKSGVRLWGCGSQDVLSFECHLKAGSPASSHDLRVLFTSLHRFGPLRYNLPVPFCYWCYDSCST